MTRELHNPRIKRFWERLFLCLLILDMLDMTSDENIWAAVTEAMVDPIMPQTPDRVPEL
jgi:hypothetical protein